MFFGKRRPAGAGFAKGRAGVEWIIAGLGNPGGKYEKTRHNVGFAALDHLSAKWGVTVRRAKFGALCGNGNAGGRGVLLLKPQTFMNASGESLMKAADFYKLPPERLLVLFDDVSLDVGVLRIRMSGSSGGHNGLKNIIYQLETDVFTRVRVGIGVKPEKWDLADYVLSVIGKDEKDDWIRGVTLAGEAVEFILENGFEPAMNKYNRKVDQNRGNGD